MFAGIILGLLNDKIFMIFFDSFGRWKHSKIVTLIKWEELAVGGTCWR